MRVDMFLKLSNVKGESVDTQYPGAIDIDSMSWSISLGAAHESARGGTGKVEMKGVVVAKGLDSASPALRAHCCSGTHFDEAVIVKRKAGKTPLEYYKLTMKDVIIAQMNTELTEGEQPDYEILTFKFTEYHEEYRAQNADGSGAAPIRHGFNLIKNTKL